MKKIKLPNLVTSRFAHQALVLEKHSPQLLFVGGLTLMGATIYSTARATLQLEATLDEIKSERATVKANMEAGVGDLSPKQMNRMHNYLYVKGVYRVAKLYAPTVILGSLSVLALTKSHSILNRRNTGLSAALAASDRALNEFRRRVRNELGEDKERELYYGVEKETVPVLDNEGRETKSKVTKQYAHGRSPYACLWGKDTSNEWDPQSAYNIAKLQSVQEYLTLQLNARGHVFLNEALDALGLDRQPHGQVVGWLSKKYGGTDGYVDFGVLDHEGEFIDFMRGREEHILLDFNVDGEIWRKI